MLNGSAPVETGLIESLAHPGGNITGTAWSGPEHHGKCLEMLKQVAPPTVRIAVTWNPTYPFEELRRTVINAAASKLGVRLQYFHITRPEEVRPALELIAAARPDALYVSAERVSISQSRAIASFAAEKKLISISNGPGFVTDGLLLYYGPVVSSIDERTANYVDRILRGAKPADLPVELPTKYELVINGKTARTIGYRIPQSVLLRADRVIQ
jgi:putative tryptophan/tyrosine transport system substrate-binding protein